MGKSTWINAFVNYLHHPSLDDAIQAEKLSWIIPFAFKTYSTDEAGNFVDFKVEVGFKKEQEHNASSHPIEKVGITEQDGTKGGSATQNTVVHRVLIGKQLVRLIDTPGIGDTRGAAKDKENLADILSVLRTYRKIHGILILLKPNEQRLDVMFKFCIQELLTHLHRDAANNIVFGFTNTRGTNYAPGDSFDPLRQLLGQFEDVNIRLHKQNVYCFDSESFRFLAAQKIHGKTIGYQQENSESWKYSVAEATRLVDHFKNIPPHEVTSTVNLYETRHRILALSRPMAAIAEAIRSTILINKDHLADLKKNDLKKKDLEKLLKTKVKTLKIKEMDRPRTTCSHADCIKHSSTGVVGLDGKGTLRTVYESMCHNPCYLSNVQLDDVGAQWLRFCAAMGGTDNCKVCGHHWQMHLHVDYEIQDAMVEIEDPDVRNQLRNNADMRRNIEILVASKKRYIDEVSAELRQVREAAAHFTVFLKRNAIMAYNDATLEYLDRCVDEEMAKVQAGGSRDKLDNLQMYRKEYQEEVRVLEEYMTVGDAEKTMLDQEGVTSLMKSLYSLRHYGEQLHDMDVTINTAHRVAHRETQHIVRGQFSRRKKVEIKQEQSAVDDVTSNEDNSQLSGGEMVLYRQTHGTGDNNRLVHKRSVVERVWKGLIGWL